MRKYPKVGRVKEKCRLFIKNVIINRTKHSLCFLCPYLEPNLFEMNSFMHHIPTLLRPPLLLSRGDPLCRLLREMPLSKQMAVWKQVTTQEGNVLTSMSQSYKT